jgi:hypothetical protein
MSANERYFLLDWEMEIALMMRATGLPLEDCQKEVILRWLEKGDVAPLAHFLASGIPLHPHVSTYLAGMLKERHIPLMEGRDGQAKPVEYPYRLVVRRRGKTKGSKPKTDIRDYVFAGQVRQRMVDLGETLEVAVEEVAHLQGGAHLGSTVLAAYNRRFGKRRLDFGAQPAPSTSQ